MYTVPGAVTVLLGRVSRLLRGGAVTLTITVRVAFCFPFPFQGLFQRRHHKVAAGLTPVLPPARHGVGGYPQVCGKGLDSPPAALHGLG